MLLFLSISLSLIADLFHLGGAPQVMEQDSVYEKIALTDSTTLEVYQGDSILVVFTACAPQCSSCARVYNKDADRDPYSTLPLHLPSRYDRQDYRPYYLDR